MSNTIPDQTVKMGDTVLLMETLKPAFTKFVCDDEDLMILEGAHWPEKGTRVEIDQDDYEVHGVRVRYLGTEFDVYVMCHKVEETGAEFPLT